MPEPFVGSVFDGPSGRAELRRLGIEEVDLVATVQAAEMARNSCGPFDPSNAPGMLAWIAACGTLADRMVNQGWEQRELKGLPLVTNRDTEVSIAITSGDAGTGLADVEPKSKYSRGPESASLVRSNVGPLFDGTPPIPSLPEDVERTTWWLLIYSNDETVRAELSLPVGIGDDGRLSVWRKRIILDLPDLTAPPMRSDDEEEPPIPEINVQPRR